jgi:hypothetical protein
MTIEDMKTTVRTVKEIGHSSKVLLPISAVEKLIADAERYRALPKIARDAARALETIE